MIDPINYFLPYQKLWITEPASLSMGEKSRRVGFTHTQAYLVVERAVRAKESKITNGDNYFHSSADRTASDEFVEECERWCRVFQVVAETIEESEVIDDEEITTRQLRFRNGARIVCGTSNPKFFRSKGGHVGLDEFAFHARPRELFKAAHATAMFWGYTLRIWSTHNGEGSMFNQMLKRARDGKLKASVHRVTIMDAVEQGIVERIKRLPARDDNARQAWLEELRSTVPDDETWNEEYLCIPGSDQSSLLSYGLIAACEVPNLNLLHIDELDPAKTYFAGYDVGRKKDLSVLWVLEKVGDVFWTRMVKELAGVDYTAQEMILRGLMENRAVKRLCIDSTGIGDMLGERMHQAFGGRVEPVYFTAPVKSDLAMPLLRLFQDKLVRLPDSSDVREDLHKIRRIITSSNNVRLEADRDELGHADRFWALALAYHAADDLNIPLPAPQPVKPFGW